jgi:hypothetical protein
MSRRPPPPRSVNRRFHVGLFDDAHALVAAARVCRERGLPIADVQSPTPIHGLDEVLDTPRSRLPVVCFVGGLTGLTLALLFEYWSSAVDWALDVGGKPWDSLPAFVPVAFELTVLIAGLSTAAAFVLRSRLGPGRRPLLADRRVTDDRYALVVEERDASVPTRELRELLLRLGAVECRDELVAMATSTSANGATS